MKHGLWPCVTSTSGLVSIFMYLPYSQTVAINIEDDPIATEWQLWQDLRQRYNGFFLPTLRYSYGAYVIHMEYTVHVKRNIT